MSFVTGAVMFHYLSIFGSSILLLDYKIIKVKLALDAHDSMFSTIFIKKILNLCQQITLELIYPDLCFSCNCFDFSSRLRHSFR